MRNVRMAIWVMVIILSVASGASAEVIRGIDIDFVTIGNAGNPGDTRTEAKPSGCGAVDYSYQIGKYETTNGQWDSFVSAAGAPNGNDGGYSYNASWTGDNVPTNNVSWYEAAQFCNYLTSGDKSLGAYQFSGDNTNPGDYLGIDRDSAISAYGIAYVIPTEAEWYKAAYYRADGSGYSTYANGLDTITRVADNGWNYYGGAYSSPWNIGTGTMEQNGTFDIMGNVWEWNEVLIGSFGYRGYRGGAFNYYSFYSGSSYRLNNVTSYNESNNMGFRVASVPEPVTLLLLGLGGLMLRGKR